MNEEHQAHFLRGPEAWSNFVEVQDSDFRADLSGVVLLPSDAPRLIRRCSFVDADLRNSTLDSIRFFECDFSAADLSGASLESASLIDSTLENALFRGCNLRGASIDGRATAAGVVFAEADLSEAQLADLDLTNADFTSASLSAATLLRSMAVGAVFVEADLSEAKLVGLNLTDADLTSANLRAATLENATLTGANLTDANLTDADLRGATLTGATVDGCNFSGARYDADTMWPSGFDPVAAGAESEKLAAQRPDFETHLTLAPTTDLDALRPLANQLELKLLHIVLDRGATPSQPMLTFRGSGTLIAQKGRAEVYRRRLREHGFEVTRTKVESAWENPTVWGASENYCEFHIKVLLDNGPSSIAQLRELVVGRGAHLSENAVHRDQTIEHRFVTQRSKRSPHYANDQFLLLVALIEHAGFTMLKTEREHVVYDSNPSVDHGWLPTQNLRTHANVPKPNWPEAFALTAESDRPRVFDPALAHYSYGFSKGAPTDADDQWHIVRQGIFATLLAAVAASDLRNSLVARGSAMLPYWLGAESRRPGDIDWVVHPATTSMTSEAGEEIINKMVALLAAHLVIETPAGVATLQLNELATDSIWTYDRVPGRRITVPWHAPSMPVGTIQMDFVFEEELWMPPVAVAFDHFDAGDSLLTAGPEQSLAWKLMWLATDIHPQGKDLYDAVLLAERYPIDKQLLFRALTDDYRTGQVLGKEHRLFTAELPMSLPIDWGNFELEYPEVGSDPEPWKRRLSNALRPTFH